MKYRVYLSAKKISDPDREVKLVAVSAENAKEIGNMRYGKKGFEATNAVRLGTQPSTVQTLNGIREEFITAMDEGNKDIAQRHEKTFYATLAHIKDEMDVVAYQLALKHLPDLPPLGK
jgi:hypothetical protein